MKTGTLFITACLLVATTYSACEKDNNNTIQRNTMNQADRDFLVNASFANIDEMDAGRVAMGQQGASQKVKDFGYTMLSDHDVAERDLKTLSVIRLQLIPSTPDSMHQAMKQQLLALQGSAFDAAYMQMQVADHQNTIDLFQYEIDNGINQEVKDYANKYLPKIMMHKQMADDIAASLNTAP